MTEDSNQQSEVGGQTAKVVAVDFQPVKAGAVRSAGESAVDGALEREF